MRHLAFAGAGGGQRVKGHQQIAAFLRKHGPMPRTQRGEMPGLVPDFAHDLQPVVAARGSAGIFGRICVGVAVTVAVTNPVTG